MTLARELLAQLSHLVEAGDKDGSMVKTEELLGLGIPAGDIVRLAIPAALESLHDRFISGRSSPEDMIIAVRAAKSSLAVVERHLPKVAAGPFEHPVVLGTLEGDVHDLAKEVLSMHLRAMGLKVLDLGVSVPNSRFLSAVLDSRAVGLAISCHLGDCQPALRELTLSLRATAAGRWVRVILGGPALNSSIAAAVGAQGFAGDVDEGLRLIRPHSGNEQGGKE